MSFLRHLLKRPAAASPTAPDVPGSLRWRLKYDNPRGLSKAQYVAELEAQRSMQAAVEPEVDELAEIREQLQAAHRRGQRLREAISPQALSDDEQIAKFEREMARDAARRR